MNKQSYLLPHSYQLFGWGCLAFALIATLIYFFMIVTSISSGDILGVVAICFATAGLLLLCFSKEKTEDEYIAHLRTRVLTWIVAYAFFASALKTVLSLTLVWLVTVDTRGFVTLITSFLFTNPIALGIVYILAFKTSILVANRKCKENG